MKSQLEAVKEAHEAAVKADALFTTAYDELGPKAMYRRIESFWCSVLASLVAAAIAGTIGFIIGRAPSWWGGP